MRHYLAFSYRMSFDPNHPTYQEMTAYIEYIMIAVRSPQTVLNKIAHIRGHMTSSGVKLAPFFHPKVLAALEAIKRDKSHVPQPKLPLPMCSLRRVMAHLPQDKMGHIQAAVILLIYHAALRQGEVLPPAVKQFNATYHLTRGDVRLLTDFGMIRIKSGKTLQYHNQTRDLTIHQSMDERYCPVKALRKVVMDTPTQNPHDPMFMFPDTRLPVPKTYMNGAWREVLSALHIPSAPFSLHSLRKAAATEAHRAGCPDLEIKDYGGWTSDAYKLYITKKPKTQVQTAISKALAKSK